MSVQGRCRLLLALNPFDKIRSRTTRWWHERLRFENCKWPRFAFWAETVLLGMVQRQNFGASELGGTGKPDSANKREPRRINYCCWVTTVASYLDEDRASNERWITEARNVSFELESEMDKSKRKRLWRSEKDLKHIYLSFVSHQRDTLGDIIQLDNCFPWEARVGLYQWGRGEGWVVSVGEGEGMGQNSARHQAWIAALKKNKLFLSLRIYCTWNE